jgi:excisionase family DNA binding protein
LPSTDTITATTGAAAPDPWLDLDESADYVGVHTMSIRRAVRNRTLKHARVGGKKLIRIRRSWLDQWLEKTAK